MPYVIRNPWDRLPPAGFIGQFRRWTGPLWTQTFHRSTNAAYTPKTTHVRSLLNRFEAIMFAVTGGAAIAGATSFRSSQLQWPLWSHPTNYTQFFTGLHLPSGAATANEYLRGFGEPTDFMAATIPTIAATSFPAATDLDANYRIRGLTSGATAVAYPAATNRYDGAEWRPNWPSLATGSAGVVNHQITTTIVPLSVTFVRYNSTYYFMQARIEWQGGPSRYPCASGADMTSTAWRYPSGFVDGEAVKLELAPT